MEDLITTSELKIGKYKHYKGDVVEVIGLALHSETLEEMAVYRHIDGRRAGEPYYWVRPLKMFNEVVEVNGETVKRFVYLDS